MPHAELKYSDNLKIDAVALLREIEQVILRHDASAGECKGRGYPTEIYHHTHLLLDISMLTKPHRDAGFTKALLADLEATLHAHLSQRCFISFGIHYSDKNYVTTSHQP
ncbi:hypothetical protein [Shimia sediminis]|uniref:hypothetical protein n=1 Tax=Shimia sediminis TaxID=2497945 RepID=UPI000F8DE021|nr:hypothetical protein [Shimia sediminis]